MVWAPCGGRGLGARPEQLPDHLATHLVVAEVDVHQIGERVARATRNRYLIASITNEAVVRQIQKAHIGPT